MMISRCNPLPCILSRQIDDHIDYCKRIINQRFKHCDNLYRKDFIAHYGCVNAIEFSQHGELLVSGGDDRRVLLWNMDKAIQGKGTPMAMRAQHNSNIFCLGYDNTNTRILSGGNDDQVIVHDLKTGDPIDYYLHEKPVYGLSVHPEDDNIFCSACDDGRILMFDIRNSSSTEQLCLAQSKSPFHSVRFNPVKSRQVATANADEGVSMWDVRKPLEPVLRYGFESQTQSCMNVCFNSAGTKLLALKRRLPPVLYDVDSTKLLCHFDQPGYYNSCTMKSCCFAGDDESYILSGSDDFNLYMWKIPNEDVNWVESAHIILNGHRSIVNHVRYNSRHNILASSGVEKIIKIWSPFSLGLGSLGSLMKGYGQMEKQRKVYTHDEYIRLVLRNGQFMAHDYSNQSTREDPRMMAFFDSLVQREIEGWSSEDGPAGPQSPSDSEDIPTAPPDISATDSDDDSTASDTQLMRSFLGAKSTNNRHKSRGGVAPARPFESPNRISRLIGNCRNKLMRLAALEGGNVKNLLINSTLIDDTDEKSCTDEDKLNKLCGGGGGSGSGVSSGKNKKSKSVKRKQIKLTGRRKYTLLKIQSDSESDSEINHLHMKTRSKTNNNNNNNNNNKINNKNNSSNNISIVDQPSTSSGVSFKRSRYSVRSIPIDSDLGESNYSSSSSNSDDIPIKRQRLKNHPEKSTKNYKNKSERFYSKNKTKNINNNNNININNNNNTSCSSNNNIITTDNDDDDHHENLTKTPTKMISKEPPTPDSGFSTVEKCDIATDSSVLSDRERTVKRIEFFKKKVNTVRKG